MFDRFDRDEKRRLLFGSVLFAVGSLVIGIGAFPDSSPAELLVYAAGTVVFGGVAALLARELYRE